MLAAATLALTAAACSGGDGGSEAPATTAAPAAARPSSPAKLTIVSPRNGQTVGEAAELRLGLNGGKIVNQTTTRVQGDEGHIHLHVDGKLVDMNYGCASASPSSRPGSTSSRSSSSPPTTPFDPRILTQAAFQVAE